MRGLGLLLRIVRLKNLFDMLQAARIACRGLKIIDAIGLVDADSVVHDDGAVGCPICWKTAKNTKKVSKSISELAMKVASMVYIQKIG